MNKTRLLLAGLLFLITLQGAGYFLGRCRLSAGQWLMFNACAVANFTYLTGLAVFLIWRTRVVMYMAVLPLFFFGSGGLFVFPWKGMNLIAQASHLLMTAVLLLMLADMFRLKDYRAGSVGLLLGTLVFSWFLAVQQDYTRRHWSEFTRAVGADIRPGPGGEPDR